MQLASYNPFYIFAPLVNLPFTFPRISVKTSPASVEAMRSGKQTHSEGQCRQWSAVYYTHRPKAGVSS